MRRENRWVKISSALLRDRKTPKGEHVLWDRKHSSLPTAIPPSSHCAKEVQDQQGREEKPPQGGRKGIIYIGSPVN